MTTFTPDELVRYRRHLSLTGFGPMAQERLKRGSVLVVGAGGLGCPALLYLAAAGVGRIVIVDDDRIDVSNLQRQVLYSSENAGEAKARVAERRLRALNPLIDVEARVERFARQRALELVSAADVVVDGSDNFGTRYLVNDACVMSERPFVYGAIQGFAGQVSVFNYRGGPTYRCLFPEPPEPELAPNCAEAGVLGVLPGIVGAVQATEAIKVLTGVGSPLAGQLWLFDALTMRSQLVALTADPCCREVRDLPPDDEGLACAAPKRDSVEIHTGALRASLQSGNAPQLIDVREGWERASGAIEGSAHVPLSELQGEDGQAVLAPFDRERSTIVYCAVGARSARAVEILRRRFGFQSVASLRGGMKAWSAQR
ncbi:MAG TPA: HesA/MoeB/ThiF family protein [Candidatus Synoicihabitans sp.]|nr:HesA/MoeB/ThiF family protein [Candidatus Synoicihabitans sp.]